MENSGRWHGTRIFALAAVACVTAAALSGCASKASTGSTTATPGSASASGSASGTAGPPAATGTPQCSTDYCDPLDWATAKASTPLKQIPPFSEPLNVVISARSTVSLAAIEQALAQGKPAKQAWKTVSTTSEVSVAGIHLKCISSEMANVAGGGYVAQSQAWRLGGCLDGNDLSISGDEDHVRIWSQPVPGSKNGAWFIAASYETMCLVRDGTLQTASTNKVYAALHSSGVYHCVDGGPGTFHSAHPDGYDDAAADFSAAILAAAKSRGWTASRRTVTVSRQVSSGEGGVPFDNTVYVLTVTA
jgi:hypothetical protein